MKRKFLIALLTTIAAAALAFGLSACTNNAETESPDEWGNVYTISAAYAEAQELGYTGSLEEFIAAISGKDGTDGDDGTGITKAEVNEAGNLIIYFSDGTSTDLGSIRGENGKDGDDGTSILKTEINEDGELIIYYSDGTSENLGRVKGDAGKDGASITKTEINAEGHLILTFSDGDVIDCGDVKGIEGAGIDHAYFNASGELIAVLTDGSEINCGAIPSCSHRYSDWQVISEPTCTSIGCEIHTCTLCGYTEYTFLEQTGHTFGEWQELINTCTAHWQVRICSVCGESQLKQLKPVGHLYINGVCIVCGESENTDIKVPDFDRYNSTYGYEFLGTMADGEALQSLYEEIDNDVKAMHVNTALDLSDDGAFAEINFGDLGLSKDEALAVWKTYKDDNPLFYWLSNTVQYSDSTISLLVEKDYLIGKARAFYNQLIEDKVEEYASILYSGATAYDIALAYHDAILTAVDYSYNVNNQAEDSAWAHNIIGVFNEQGAVCEGYARTYQLLLNYSGVKNIFVTGDGSGENHAWNLVQMEDDNWYWCDLTWDDTYVGGLNGNWKWGISYNYFLVNDTQNTLINEGGWEYGENVSFLENHAYDTSKNTGVDFLYDLPERAEEVYVNDGISLTDEIIIGNMTLQVVGYNALELHNITGEGSVIIPDTISYEGREFSVISLGNNRNDCIISGNAITSVTIPASVIFIWDFAFRNYSLENIYVSQDNPKFTSADGVLYTKSLYTLIQYPSANPAEEYVIPDETHILAYWSFASCKYLSNLTFGKNVAVIWMANWGGGYRDGEAQGFGGNIVTGGINDIYGALAGEKIITISPENKAFIADDFALYDYNKTSIMYIYDKTITTYKFPATITSFDSRIFDACTMLESFSVEENHPTFSVYDGVLYNKDLTEIVAVPPAIKGEITIPENVTEISTTDGIWRCFINCTGLTKVNLPEGLKLIGSAAFSGCINIESINIPSTVTQIGPHAFYGLAKIEQFILPEDLICIDAYAFDGTGYYLNEDNWTGNALYLGNYLIAVKDSEETTFVVKDGTTGIAGGAFLKTGYTEIIIPEGVKFIGSDAFNNSNITTITLPDSLVYIGSSIFDYCYNLTHIQLPDNLTDIPKYAFWGCDNLKSIVIGANINTIGHSAFSDCPNLDTVYFKGSADEFSDLFVSTSDNESFINAEKYFYSETQPTDGGNYWHYAEDGVTPVIW